MAEPDLPLLLIGGTLCDEDLWQGVAAPLATVAQTQICRWDEETDPAALAQRLLREAPPRFALAGMSLGGSIALEIGALAPQRLLGLALIDAHPYGEAVPGSTPAARQAARIEQLEHARRHGLADLVRRRLWPSYVAEQRLQDAALRERIAAMAERCGLAAFERQIEMMRQRVDRRAVLAALPVPTLVAWGRDDRLCPDAWQQAYTAAHPQLRRAALPGCGHFAVLEDPPALAEHLLEWLDACRRHTEPHDGSFITS